MKTNYFMNMNSALGFLLKKYQVGKNGTITETGELKTEGKYFKLLPWRMERRFIELKKIITNGTLEDISTLRFANISEYGTSLDKLIFREFDLCEFFAGSPVTEIFAVFHKDKTMNAIVKLENGCSCSIECSVMLPKGTMPIDRHEIIARRGVASDQLVDSQVPQSSIYEFTSVNTKRFTDVDFEIFGFSQNEVSIVRSAFNLLKNSISGEEHNSQFNHVSKLVDMAKKSNERMMPVIIEGV